MNDEIPRGIRNNNPGNIRHGETRWQGEAPQQTDSAFVQFVSPEYGIRAIAHILHTYHNEGVTTLQAVIERWAPPSENDTDAYIRIVSSESGLDPTDSVDQNLPGVIKGIIYQENGEQPYTDDQINTGIQMV